MARSHLVRPNRESGVSYNVRFIRTFQMYMAGDCAVFPAAMARRLIAAGRAERIEVNLEDEQHPAPADAEWALRLPLPPPYREGGGPDDDVL
jgi:hypothetical protein